MSVVPVLVIVIGAAVGVVWAVRRRSVLEVRVDEHADVVALHRHLSRWRLAGLVAAVVLTVVMVADVPHLPVAWDQVGSVGRMAALVPAIGGLSLLLGTIVGELTARPATSLLRTATVETRHVGDILPRRLTVTVAAGTLALVALLSLGSAMGSPDDLGRPGRTLTVTCTAPLAPRDAAWLASSSTGPWPGTFYAVPIGVALCAVLVATAVALAVIVRRPRPSATAAVLDTALRRHAGRNALLALGVAAFGTVGPVALLMGDGLGRNQCGPTWWALPAWALGLSGLVAVTLAAWCALSLLVNPVLRITERGIGDHAAHPGSLAGS